MVNMADFPRVRIADVEDEGDLMCMCEALHRENGILRISHDKVRQTLRAATDMPVDKRTGLIGVIGDRGEIEASIYLEINALWYSDDTVMMELWNYCYPQFRNSLNSQSLISFAKGMSDHFALPLMIGVLSNIRTEAKVRLYRKQLGPPAGAFFLHGITTGQGVH